MSHETLVPRDVLWSRREQLLDLGRQGTRHVRLLWSGRDVPRELDQLVVRTLCELGHHPRDPIEREHDRVSVGQVVLAHAHAVEEQQDVR